MSSEEDIVLTHLKLIENNVKYIMERLSSATLIGDRGVMQSSKPLLNSLSSIMISTWACRDLLTHEESDNANRGLGSDTNTESGQSIQGVEEKQ